MSAVPLIAPLSTPDRLLTNDGCLVVEDGCLLVAPEDTTQCACCGTPPPPPPHPGCCDTVGPPASSGCCFTTGLGISVTVTASLFQQGWGCNSNTLCGTVGWKSITVVGSGSAVYTWSSTANQCCPTKSEINQSVGTITTTYDLPAGPPCGGGVQSITGYGVRVRIETQVISGVSYTKIIVIGQLATYTFGCSAQTLVHSGNNGTNFSSTCGTSPSTPFSESISISVVGLAPCSTGGGGGDGFVFI